MANQTLLHYGQEKLIKKVLTAILKYCIITGVAFVLAVAIVFSTVIVLGNIL